MMSMRIRKRVSFLLVNCEVSPASKRASSKFFTALPPGFKKVSILSPDSAPKLASESSQGSLTGQISLENRHFLGHSLF